MGWTWQKASHYYPNGNIDRKAECDAYFTEGLNEGQYEILKSTMVGGVYYAAVRKLKQYCGENADGKVSLQTCRPINKRFSVQSSQPQPLKGIILTSVIRTVRFRKARAPISLPRVTGR